MVSSMKSAQLLLLQFMAISYPVSARRAHLPMALAQKSRQVIAGGLCAAGLDVYPLQ